MPDPLPTLSYWLGLDLGQASDFSALSILESHDPQFPRRYQGRHLQRWPLQTPYPSIAKEVAALAEALALQHLPAPVWLAVDGTGIGAAVVDLLKREPMPHIQLVVILITGGDLESRDPKT